MEVQAAKAVTNLQAIGLVLGLSLTTVFADWLLKLASEQAGAFTNRFFLVGTAVYTVSAFAWVLAMRHIKLAVIGAFYSVTVALLLAVLGAVVFREKLELREMLGIGLGISSLLLLTRW
jgi:multidrug transporter EmrE-like cation transporter